jgi:hypothetical protein
MTKKTLLDTVREFGIFEVKEVVDATDVSRQTLTNWLKDKPKLLNVVLAGIRANKQKESVK